jgi:hypothetical protein
MVSAVLPAASPVHQTMEGEVSLVRLYVLRATYLLLIVGLGLANMPEIFAHAPMSRGVIPSLLGAIWLLAFIGLRHPLEMLPLLIFEFAWKTTWFVAYGLPQWLAGRHPPTFADDLPAILLGVVIMPVVIPWTYVWSRYVRQPGARWR